jgi:hypothetical protein
MCPAQSDPAFSNVFRIRLKFLDPDQEKIPHSDPEISLKLTKIVPVKIFGSGSLTQIERQG